MRRRPTTIIRHVVLPNIGGGIAAGGILVFAASFGEFALAQILSGAAFETVPSWSADALGRSAEGRFNELAVVTFVTFAVLFVVAVATVLWTGASGVRLLPGASISSSAKDRA